MPLKSFLNYGKAITMRKLPSGGYDQTQTPTLKQIEELERLTGYDCANFNGTRRQASIYIESLSRNDNKPIPRLSAKAWILALGAKEK